MMVTQEDTGVPTSYIPPDIRGNAIMQDGRTMREHLVDVCIDISDVFNTKVRATPARVTPMKLVVDVDKWENPANALGPRKKVITAKYASPRSPRRASGGSVLTTGD
jgi:hypothetical protein